MRTMPRPAKENASSSKDTSAKGNANFARVQHFALRDTLLPKLLSGELSVATFETEAEAAR